MTIDAGLRLAQGETAQGQAALSEAAIPRIGPDLSWLTAGLTVCVIALGLRWLLPFNVDVSWWLIVGERVFDGQRLYMDILETNPPMAGSVYFVGVALAQATGLRPEVVTNALVFGLIAASLMLSWRLLRDARMPGRSAARPLAVWAIILLGILPMHHFGQREHLALLFLMPALAILIRRANGDPISLGAILIAGISAAITMSFKPYFALGVGAAILAVAATARQWRILVAPENWIAGVLVVAYALWVYIAFPAYFTVIYPVVRDVYLLLTAPWLAFVVAGATTLWLAAVFVVLLLLREIVRRAREDQSFDPAMSARLDGYVAAERDGLVEDFRKSSPDVVLVDNRDSDWSAWARTDPELAELLKPYAWVQRANGIDILKKVGP